MSCRPVEAHDAGVHRLALLVCAAACATAPAYPHVTGAPHDFDYFAGGWTTQQHRLAQRGVGSHDWEDFPATLCMTPHLDGLATVDELVFPTKGWSGLTVRTFDVAAKQWAIYWISSKTGKLDTPVRGGFAGPRGEFYGTDRDNGRPVLVRYTWLELDHDHARWEQAFSYDAARTWEVNWIADFTRADPETVCDRGRPIHRAVTTTEP